MRESYRMQNCVMTPVPAFRGAPGKSRTVMRSTLIWNRPGVAVEGAIQGAGGRDELPHEGDGRVLEVNAVVAVILIGPGHERVTSEVIPCVAVPALEAVDENPRHLSPSLRSRLYADLHSVDFAGRPRGGCAGVRFPKFALRSEGRLHTLIRRVVIAACRTTGNSGVRRG